MLSLLLSIVGILVTILFVVGTHEYAHFLTARLFDVKVLRFSIGFGKTLWHWRDKKGTEYVFALIPLGGYVKMLDEQEGSVPKKELHLAYNRQPFYKKFLIVLAGPMMNLLCAFLLYWLIFMIGFVTVRPIIGTVTAHSIAAEGGLKDNQEILSIDGKATQTLTSVMFRLLVHAGDQDLLRIEVQNINDHKIESHVLDLSNWHINALTPDPLGSLGIKEDEPKVPLIVGIIAPDSPAAGKLHLGDKLIAINKHPIKTWNDLIIIVVDHPDETVTLTLERKGKVQNISLTTGFHRSLLLKKTGFLGVGPHFTYPKELLHTVQYGPIAALPHAWQEVADLTYINLLLFGKLITGKLSVQSLGGPITIFESAGDALNDGFISFIGFLAFLSVAIGVINLVPIPGLDGGHLFIQIIEFIIRRPIPEQFLSILYRLGFLLLVFVLIQALVNDVLRL